MTSIITPKSTPPVLTRAQSVALQIDAIVHRVFDSNLDALNKIKALLNPPVPPAPDPGTMPLGGDGQPITPIAPVPPYTTDEVVAAYGADKFATLQAIEPKLVEIINLALPGTIPPPVV